MGGAAEVARVRNLTYLPRDGTYVPYMFSTRWEREMSMEHYVFSDRQLGSITEWQSAIDAEGFNLHLDDSRGFLDLNGFLPASMDGRQTGFECDHFDSPELMDEISMDAGHRWRFALAFRYGGDQYECISAYLAAAAYTKAIDGILYDCQAGEFYPPSNVAQQARKVANPAAWA